jgi:hypothetical protein
VTTLADIPVARLATVTSLCGSVVSDGVSVRRAHWDTGTALVSLKAKQCIAAVLRSWPPSTPLTVSAVGGETRLTQLLKLVAAAAIHRSVASPDDKSNETEISASSSASTAALDVHAQVLSSLRAAIKSILFKERNVSFLVAECVSNFLRCTSSQPPIVRESLHGYPTVASYGGSVVVPAAKQLFVSFDAQCAFGPVSPNPDSPATLSMYSGEASPNTLLHTFSNACETSKDVRTPS